MGGLVSGDDGGVDGGRVGVGDYRLVGGDVEKLVGCLVGGIIGGHSVWKMRIMAV
jgi:hypothetical protein